MRMAPSFLAVWVRFREGCKWAGTRSFARSESQSADNECGNDYRRRLIACLEREPPRGKTKSDGHTVDTVVCACGVTAHSPSAATEGTLSGGPAGDDYVKSGNAGVRSSWRMRAMSWRHVALADRSRFCRASAFALAAHTLLIGMCGPSRSMPRVCSVAPFFTFTARLLLTSKTLSLTGHSVDTFSVAPRSAHTFDVWPLRPSPLP